MTLKILGYRADIENVDDTLDFINNLKEDCSTIQVFDADTIAGEKHLLHAYYQALNSFDRNENLANDLGIEVSLRLSAQRQISKALKKVGLKKGKINICFLLMDCGDEIEAKLDDTFIRDDTVLEPQPEILKNIYKIPQEELDIMDMEDILIDEITSFSVNT